MMDRCHCNPPNRPDCAYSKGGYCSPTPSNAIAALYESAGDAAARVAIDKAWAEFRGFTLPGPRDDDDLGRAVDCTQKEG